MVDFSEFSKHVAQQFNSMKKADELFVVDLDKDELWDRLCDD